MSFPKDRNIKYKKENVSLVFLANDRETLNYYDYSYLSQSMLFFIFLFLDVNQYYLVKGDGDDDTRCVETSCDATLAEKTKVSPVRCCSDTQISGWRKKPSCWVWSESKFWGECKNLNWEDANTLCISQGGRLCTKDELEASCAKETGCSFDYRRVWSSTAGKSK